MFLKVGELQLCPVSWQKEGLSGAPEAVRLSEELTAAAWSVASWLLSAAFFKNEGRRKAQISWREPSQM